MTAYWIVFSLAGLGALSPIQLSRGIRLLAFVGFSIVVVCLVGSREEIGGDWENYIEQYSRISEEGLSRALKQRNVGYALICWLSAQLNLGIYGANCIAATIFTTSLGMFCWKQPLPWLAWSVSIPYLIIVVAMGYTSQSLALGMALLAYLQLEKKCYFRFFAFILIGYFFHKSVFVLSLLFLVEPVKNLLIHRGAQLHRWNLIITCIGAVFTGCLVWLFVGPELTHLINYYIFRDQWSSGGVYLRLFMNLVPALLLLVLFREFQEKFMISSHWYAMAVLCLLLFGFVSIGSTAIDRFAVYITPLQIYVWSRAPFILNSKVTMPAITLGVVIYSGLVLGLWLNFANHRDDWVPYTSIFLG